MTPIRSVSPRVILTYGRYDGLCQDHIRFLRDLAANGADLIVGCTTDALATDLGRPCKVPFEQRRAFLESCRWVDRVIPHSEAEQPRTDIVNYNASALAMGLEWAGSFDDLQDIAQVLYLPRRQAAILVPEKQGYMQLATAG
jgi:glycerol-3-phosphate cytidylyltransferase